MSTDQKAVIDMLRSIDERLRRIEIKVEAAHVRIAGLEGTAERIEGTAREAEISALHAWNGVSDLYRLATAMPDQQHDAPIDDGWTEALDDERH